MATAFRNPDRGFCTVTDCDRPEEAGGLCWGHRKRKVEGLTVGGPLREPYAEPGNFARVVEAAIDLAAHGPEPRPHGHDRSGRRGSQQSLGPS